MYFDRFDICEAYYCYATLYHGGQSSPEYALHSVFERLQFNCRDSATHNPEALTENGRAIFDRLVGGEQTIRDRR
jgi:hypothetical protein